MTRTETATETAADAATDRDRKSRDERERLYRAGWAVMRRNGYANAHITEILAEAELGTRAFYRQFESKDDLLIAMFRDNAEVAARRLEEQVEAAGEPLDRVLAWIDGIIDLGHDPRHREIARMFTAPPIRAVFADAGEEALAKLREPLHAALVDGRSGGEFPACDPDPDAATIQAIVWQLFENAIHDPDAPDPAAARAHAERFVLPALGIDRGPAR